MDSRGFQHEHGSMLNTVACQVCIDSEEKRGNYSVCALLGELGILWSAGLSPKIKMGLDCSPVVRALF